MKLTTAGLIRSAGICALLGGLCYVFVGVFHPANVPESVTTARWAVVHVLACATSFLGLLGLSGLYARQAVKCGWLGLVGFVMLSLWLVLIMGFSFVEAFVLPHLASVTPAFVEGWMGMFNGDPSPTDLGVLPMLWTLTGPLYIGGGVLFGIATFRARILPRGAAVLLALGTALVGARSRPTTSSCAAEGADADRTGLGLVGICTDGRATNLGDRVERPIIRRCRLKTAPELLLSWSTHKEQSRRRA